MLLEEAKTQKALEESEHNTVWEEVNSTLQEFDSIIGQASADRSTPTQLATSPELIVSTDEPSPNTVVSYTDSSLTNNNISTDKKSKIPPAVSKKPIRNKPGDFTAKQQSEQDEQLLLDSLSDEDLEVPADITMETKSSTSSSSIFRSNSALSPRNCNTKNNFTSKTRREKVRSVGDSMDIKIRDDENDLTKAVSPDEFYTINYNLRHSTVVGYVTNENSRYVCVRLY